MLKALFLDMDDTLCDTAKANTHAKALMADKVMTDFGQQLDGAGFSNEYIRGMYKQWTAQEQAQFQAIREQHGELFYRVQWLLNLFSDNGISDATADYAAALQSKFEDDRMAAFDFYPGIKDFLLAARKKYTLVVITNGPEYSQLPKLKAANVADYVDHVIIGGQEPAQKPAKTIFTKALNLANCDAHEAVHVGDSLAADIVGANNSGITSIWVQHEQLLDKELGAKPDHIVARPAEFPALIEKLFA